MAWPTNSKRRLNRPGGGRLTDGVWKPVPAPSPAGHGAEAPLRGAAVKITDLADNNRTETPETDARQAAIKERPSKVFPGKRAGDRLSADNNMSMASLVSRQAVERRRSKPFARKLAVKNRVDRSQFQKLISAQSMAPVEDGPSTGAASGTTAGTKGRWRGHGFRRTACVAGPDDWISPPTSSDENLSPEGSFPTRRISPWSI